MHNKYIKHLRNNRGANNTCVTLKQCNRKFCFNLFLFSFVTRKDLKKQK